MADTSCQPRRLRLSTTYDRGGAVTPHIQTEGRSMKTSTLRDAICIALFTAAACAATPAIAQEEVAAEVGAEPEATTGQQPREEPDPQEGGLDGQSPAPDADPDPESEVTELASMTVTGTRIRGGTTPSPVIEITSEQIREEGFTDLGEVIRSVPQNF